MTPAAAYAIKLGDSNADFTITSSPDADIVIGERAGDLPSDAVRNPNASASGAYLKGDTLGKSLDVTVKGGNQIASDGKWPPKNQIYLMGNYRSAVSGSGEYDKLVNATVTDDYSNFNHGGVVNLTLADNAKFYSLIYGGRNDLVGTDPASGGNPNTGDSCGNTINITLNKGAQLGASLIMGGRSGQGEGQGMGLDKNGNPSPNPHNINLKKGYQTDNNTVIIKGDASIKDSYATNKTNGFNLNFPAGGIWGAEGWQANNNYVYLDYAYIKTNDDKTRKLGIVGGRGLYNFRIHDNENSAIANNNIVVITNSNIGTFSGPGMSVFGGYSYGQAKNNIVAMENTTINGNVYGGLELLGKTEADPNNRRQLHSNLVSLHNVTLEGNSAFYGTATADAKRFADDKTGWGDYDYVVSDQAVNETTLLSVNRRRGIAHIGGQVKAGSAYVRYIHFGSYIDANTLQAHQTYDVFSPYYPNGSSSGAGAAVLVTFTQGKESTNLNQLVAGSYLWNTNGFHSALNAKDLNQSHSTDGQHNFWVNVYTNLSSVVNGDGTKFNTGTSLFDASGNDVNHFYNGSANDYGYNANSEDDLSLLAMDDGMILSGSTGNGIMHDFRKHYQGRVLYLGVNNGKDYAGTTINAVDIHFGDIEDFRQHNGQNANAFGNTQVGIFMDGKGSTGQYDQDPYHRDPVGDSADSPRSWKDMVITIPNFKIVQNNSIVADATYGFYKYLHIDGDVTQDANGRDVKQTGSGDAAGVGIKYWLKSLTIRPGALLTLKGYDVTGTAPTTQDVYTLSAYVTGNGHVAIAENTEVIMGDTRVNDEAVDTDMLSGTGGFEQENTYENQYTGATIIRKGARLFQGSQGALGSAAHHTSNLVLENDGAGANGAKYYLQGHSQIIGGLLVSDTSAVDLSTQSKGTFDPANNKGYLDVQGYARVNDNGEVKGNANSTLAVTRGVGDIYSQNDDMSGTFALKSSSAGYLHNANSFTAALADIDATSELNFMSVNGTATTPGGLPSGSATIGAIRNAGDVYLSNRSKGEDLTSLNTVNIVRAYTGIEGSNIFYRGVVQGPTNSTVDAIQVPAATGSSLVAFAHFNNLTAGIFSSSRGERTDKSVGIPVFIIDNRDAAGSQLHLSMNNFGVVDKDDPGYEWVYSLGYNDAVNSATDREWVLYNSIDGRDNYQPRPEPGAYTAIAHSWSRMHMRLHDRFGQAYETDPFDAEHKPASAWIRQEGRLTKFRMSESGSRTRSFTSLTQVGGDLVRKEIDDVWKYNLGFFVGDLQNYSRSRTWNTAKGRAEGYGLGVYGTLYTGNSPDDGFYIDTWLSYNHFENKIYGNRPEFKYNSSGWVYSIETGLTLPLGETGDKPEDKYIWTLQPEFQVIWDGVEAGTARDSTGTTYSLLGNDNVVLRAGARLHANNMNKGLGYIEANWIHNTHKLGVMQGNHPFYMEGGQDLGELRFGLEGRATTNTLCWMTLGTQRGRHAYHNEIVQFGLRYMFK